MITAEDKFKHIESTWITHQYTYYHCTRKKVWYKCKQKVITVEKLEAQIIDILKSIEILPEFTEWAINIIKRDFHKELEEREIIYNNLQKELKTQENKLNNLTDMLLEERIDKDDFDRRKIWIKNDIKETENRILNMSNRRDEKFNNVTDFFQFASTAVKSFNEWNIMSRRKIFNSLGQNFILKDWKLTIELNPWIKPLEKNAIEINKEYQRFETTKKSTTISDSNTLNVVFSKWHPH